MISASTKQVFLSVLFFFLLVSFNNTQAQTKVGVKAGVNFSKLNVKDENGNEETTQSTPGILLGLTIDIPVSGNFYIQPGIQYAKKGFEQETGGFYGFATNFKVKVEYLELPVNILYKPQLGAGRLMLGAGPYIGYGSTGNWKSDSGVTVQGDINIGNKGDVIFRNDAVNGGNLESYTYGRPLDYGANFLVGYEFFGRLSVQFNAQVGVANLQPEFAGNQRDGNLRNSAIGFSFGYKF